MIAHNVKQRGGVSLLNLPPTPPQSTQGMSAFSLFRLIPTRRLFFLLSFPFLSVCLHGNVEVALKAEGGRLYSRFPRHSFLFFSLNKQKGRKKEKEGLPQAKDG